MTRDEAIAAVRAASVLHGNALGDGQFVDRMAALGLLKLDETKTALDRAYAAMDMDPLLIDGRLSPSRVVSCLDEAGLQISDKAVGAAPPAAPAKAVDERVWELLRGRELNLDKISLVGGWATLSQEAVHQIILILAVAGFKIVDS